MKRAGKLVVLGLTVAATSSVPQLAQVSASATPAPVVAQACGTSTLAPDTGDARVRNGSKVVEPGSEVPQKVADAVEFEMTKQRLLTSDTAARATKWINIPIYFHVIHYGNKGKLSKKAINAQIAVLDNTYRGKRGGVNLKINFFLKKITYSNKKLWFKSPQKYEQAYKKKLHMGGKASLNIYTADLGNELLGWSTFPWDYKKKPKMDGTVIHYGSLPGGPFQDYSLGHTATHEVGHWLGLYHTFGRDYPLQSGCAAGDKVDDTPAQGQPTAGCPADDAIPDTCPDAAGVDPIHNYMDYGSDVCMTEFTGGQSDRVRLMWKKYRAAK